LVLPYKLVTLEKHKKATSTFLENLDKKGLYNYDSEFLDEDRLANFTNNNKIFVNVFLKLNELLDKTNHSIGQDELFIFYYSILVNWLTSQIELIKKFLMLLIDRKQIAFTDDATIGYLVNLISKGLGYNENEKNDLRDNFFVDFRNAVYHINYKITIDGVYIDICKKTIHYDIQKLFQLAEDLKEILMAITDFVNSKSGELEKEVNSYKNKLANINKEIVEGRKEINELKRKLNE